MNITVLLALLGVGLLAALMGGSSGGSDDPEPPVDNTPDEITVLSGQKAVGGGGNDILTAEDPVDHASAFGGAGDDTIILLATHSELSGGAGNDLITLSGSSDTVFGGEGNDILTTGQGTVSSGIYGGYGDDQLHLSHITHGTAPAASYFGGNGQDVVSADLTLDPAPGATGAALFLAGGNDDDIFDLTVDVAAVRPTVAAPPKLLTTIGDFEPGLDQLLIDGTGATYRLVEAANGNYTDVILSYAATATAPAAHGIIRLTGVTGLTASDISFAPGTEPGPEPEPEPITLGAHQTVQGTAGDDTISSGPNVTGSTVFGGNGNDSMDVTADFSELRGDSGNDLITLDGYHSTIFGGAGNDTLTTGTETVYARLFGGSGNDTLNLDYTQFDSVETPASDAGTGDDRLNVNLALNINPDKVPDAPDVEGNDGSDIFDLDIQLGDVLTDPDTALERDLLVIKDFVPGQDVLQIDTHGAAVELREAGNGSYTDVLVTYPATGTTPEVVGVIRLEDVSGLTLADIVVSAGA